MPLYKTIHHNSNTTIYVWHITESFSDLSEVITLNDKSTTRLNGMKSEIHQRAFLCVRKLLNQAGYSDFDLYYDESGKPHLNDNKFISITHSHEFAAIIISDQKVGIDIELQREKILRIADKFVEQAVLAKIENHSTTEYVKKLTVHWGAKEAIFKIRNEKGISFKNHIQVNSFELNQTETTALLDFETKEQLFHIYFEEFENFTLVYAFDKND